MAMSLVEPDFRPLVVRNVLPAARDVRKVPFVELLGGRVQGVVSSGSDSERVYVSWIQAGSSGYYCSTNNNRPCGGLRGSPCKHLGLLLAQAAVQFGCAHVAAYLKLPGDPAALAPRDLIGLVGGAETKEPAGAVFSRFLAYLSLCERAAPREDVPEGAWFL